MSFNVDAVTLTLLAVLAALIIGILAYISAAKAKASRARRHATLIRNTIIDYFRRSGVEVSADATCFDDSGRYTAVVESEPMKRFRLSHIIEMTLREHVRKSCGLELEKIYWRFPIKEATQAVTVQRDGEAKPNGAEEQKRDEHTDDYINEGLENYRHIPKPEVTELSWETFEQMASLNQGKDEAPKR
jgi:type II secretory pathway pseudopilin PulG